MSKRVAYGGILLGLNIILLLSTNLIPINTLLLLGLASLPISIVIMEWGPKAGIIFYLGSVFLSFIIMPNKTHWVVYAFTFGIYGLIKYAIEQDRTIFIECLFKFLFANIVGVVLYLILRLFVYIPMNIIVIIAFEVIFIIYDYSYSLFIDYYNDKLRKIIEKHI